MTDLLTTQTTSIDGYEFRFSLRSGTESQPPRVFLHGYPENLQVWSALMKSLPTGAHLAFDWPGMGGSAAWPGGAAPQQMAQRLVRVLDHFDLGRVDLVGTDMGGQPALVAAATVPERVRSVIVMNSLVIGDEATSWEIRVLRKYGWNLKILKHLPRVVFWRARRTFTSRGAPVSQAALRDFWEYFRRPLVRQFIVRMCAGYQGQLPRLKTLYPRIECPVLALWGQRDKHFPPSQAHALVHLLRNGECHVLANAGHWMMLSHAPEVADVMSSFWRRLG